MWADGSRDYTKTANGKKREQFVLAYLNIHLPIGQSFNHLLNEPQLHATHCLLQAGKAAVTEPTQSWTTQNSTPMNLGIFEKKSR